MDKIRVLVIARTAPESGITQYILQFLENLDLQKYTVDIVSINNPRLQKWTETHHGNYFEIKYSILKAPIQYRTAWKKILTRQYDIVHFHESALSSSYPFKLASRMRVKKIILHSHNSQVDVPNQTKKYILTLLHQKIRNSVLPYVTDYCACSSIAAEWMFGTNNIQKVTILKNVVDIKKFSYSQEVREKIRASLQISPSEFILGHIGRFTYQKNHSFLLDIFSQIHKTNEYSKLLLIGSGPLEKEIKNKIFSLNLTDCVNFLGARNDVNELMQAMDLFLLPSHFEGLPIVAVEAQTAGLPCVLSDAVTDETDITGNVRFLSLNQTPEEWATEILSYFSQFERHSTDEKIRQAGFDQETQIKEIERLYSVTNNG